MIRSFYKCIEFFHFTVVIDGSCYTNFFRVFQILLTFIVQANCSYPKFDTHLLSPTFSEIRKKVHLIKQLWGC